MFTVALLAGALLFGTPRTVVAVPPRVPCPGSSTPAGPFGHACSAIEVSGSTAAGDLRLDPAFDVSLPAAQLSRAAAGDAALTGFSADGRAVFSFPVPADGPFHLYVPLAAGLAQSIERLQLSAPAGVTERSAATHGAPEAESISIDDAHLLFAWNARAFPAVRITPAPGAPPVAYGGGSSTYAQVTVASKARQIFVDFSDGVRSAGRVFSVFGR